MNKNKGTVLVSILNYNLIDETVSTVKCFQNQEYDDIDIWVVDNGSNSRCVSEVRAACPEIKIRVLDGNKGYTGGNNHALRRGKNEQFDYVLVSNNDIEIDRNAVGFLVETASKNPDVGVVGGVEVDYYSGKRRALGGAGYNLWTSRGKWIQSDIAHEGGFSKVDYVQGALVLFTRRAIESGILFDENLFMYYDEVDLGFQLKLRGLNAVVDERVLVYHKNDTYKYKDYVGYLHQRNRFYIVKKYGSWYHRMFYSIYSIVIEIPGKLLLRSFQGRL